MDVSDSLLFVITGTIQHYLTVTFISSLLHYPITSVLRNSRQNTE